MKFLKVLVLFIIGFILSSGFLVAEEGEIFSSIEKKNEFAEEVSSLIGKAWKKWQDKVLINDIEVEGSTGLLLPGDIGRGVLTSSSMLEGFNREGKPQDYITCVKAVTSALEDGMRQWQKGYTHTDLVFPQGASCVYTLPPCDNIPALVASGRSSGDKAMTEEALYAYMLFRAPKDEEGVKEVFQAAARAISECFNQWKASCSIVGILATGGIAPQPAPMGTGPGPVTGAKGENGKLIGPYFDASLMQAKMQEFFKEKKAIS